jgi:hypothetical protein
MNAQKRSEREVAVITLAFISPVGPRNFDLNDPCEIGNSFFLITKKIEYNIP